MKGVLQRWRRPAVQPAPTGRRAENVARIQQLLGEGHTSREVAAMTGLSYSTVREYISDPDGTKVVARKRSYRGTCEQCGASTDGSNGHTGAPKLCAPCTAQKIHDDRHWTPEVILGQIRRFVEVNGRKPMSNEWLRARPADPDEPFAYTSVVLREFGTWNTAMEAAGLPAEKAGKYERTPESIDRLSRSQSAAQRVRHKFARDYGDLEYTRVGLGVSQWAAIDGLNGCGRSEHVRRAVDLYLASRVRPHLPDAHGLTDHDEEET